MADQKAPVSKTPTRSAAPARTGPPKQAPKPAVAPASTAAQRTAQARPATTAAAPAHKDSVSQDILEARQPLSKGTQGLLTAFEADYAAPQASAPSTQAHHTLPASTPQQSGATAKKIDEKNHHWFWGTDMAGMRTDLKANWKDPKAVLGALDRELIRNPEGHTVDWLKRNLGRDLNDAQLRQLATTPDGKKLINELISPYQGYGTSKSDLAQIKRLTQGMPKHSRLLDDKLSPEIEQKLKANGLTQQKIGDGWGQVNFDELAVTIDKMPPGVTPEDFMRRMANDPNKTLGGARSELGGWCLFQRREHGEAKPGDIYDINIAGPENGSVVIRDMSPNQFTVSTVNGPPYGEHPIYGNRQFGFDKNDDGSVTFYTRAADRRQFQAGSLPIGAETAGYFQADTWRDWQHDIAREIQAQGGRVRPNSFTESYEVQ